MIVRFRFNYYDLEGLSSYLAWELEPGEKRMIQNLEPARRIICGNHTYCISMSDKLKIKAPKTIEESLEIAKKQTQYRIESE